MDLYFFDSIKKAKILFTSQDTEVKIYICGPTVYDNAHLGHARSAIAFDILHRLLIVNGYKVKMVKNWTDIDDKIIKKMAQTNKSLEEVTSKYIKNYQNEMKLLNILDTINPKATDYISDMITMIQKLLDDKFAYIIDDGVYFDTSKDNLYGTISHKISDDTQSRIEQNTQKKDNKDFALWKFRDDVCYDAPFGKGRPGWHIECSAMIDKIFQSSIDIHCGGSDLLFPHHENEASQSRCATKKELSRYWLHNGFVTIDGEKMSKSLGNSFFLKDILTHYHPEVVRLYMSSIHYRAELNFNEIDLLASKKRLDKLYRLKKRIYQIAPSVENTNFKTSILKALNDDMNISISLSILDEYIANANEALDKNQKDKNLKKEIVATIDFINDILGIGLDDAYKYFQFGLDDDTLRQIEDLIAKRVEAKKQKDYATADNLRTQLSSLGVVLLDMTDKTLWEYTSL